MATVIDSGDLNRYEVIKTRPMNTEATNVNVTNTSVPVTIGSQPISTTPANTVPTNVAITGQPITVTTSSSPSTKTPAVDAFGRLRVSNPFTLFDSQHRYQENDKWDTQLTGSATKTYAVNESTINLNCTTGSTDAVLRETKRVFPYQPGKSLLIMSTFAMAPGKTNQTQRVGYYGAQNGIYLEQQGTTLYFVQRSYSSGSLVETRIPQSQWNTDKFDGTGIGGTIDVTKTQILWMDIEWLGVGSVRCGFVVDGTFVMAHRFDHDNIETRTYMTTAILPLRYEIFNTGTVASSSTLKQICSTVISEGGYEGYSRRYNVDTGYASISCSVVGTNYPITSIRLNSNRLDSIVLPTDVNILLASSSDICRYQLLLNPTLNGGTWATHYNGNVDYNITATAVTGGNIVSAGYIQSSQTLSLSGLNNFNFQLGRTIAGVSDVLTLMITPVTSTCNVLADFSWYETI